MGHFLNGSLIKNRWAFFGPFVFRNSREFLGELCLDAQFSIYVVDIFLREKIWCGNTCTGHRIVHALCNTKMNLRNGLFYQHFVFRYISGPLLWRSGKSAFFFFFLKKCLMPCLAGIFTKAMDLLVCFCIKFTFCKFFIC